MPETVDPDLMGAVVSYDYIRSLSENIPAAAIAPKIVREHPEALDQFHVQVHETAATGFRKGSRGSWVPDLKLALETAKLNVKFTRGIERKFRDHVRSNVRHTQNRGVVVQLGAIIDRTVCWIDDCSAAR
jgi:hypothetical protein